MTRLQQRSLVIRVTGPARAQKVSSSHLRTKAKYVTPTSSVTFCSVEDHRATHLNMAWWLVLATLALRRLRQEEGKCRTTLGYMA